MKETLNDREVLRTLAGQIAEIAALDVREKTCRLYRGVNNLRMIRPVVLLDELPWNQLNGDGELTLRCEDAFLRGVEQLSTLEDLEKLHVPEIEVDDQLTETRRALLEEEALRRDILETLTICGKTTPPASSF